MDIDKIISDSRLIIGKRILIIGDIHSGKTEATARIINSLDECGYRDSITIIDLAPRYRRIGLGIEEYIDVKRFRYYSSEKIYAPRLMAKNKYELYKYIISNYRVSRMLLDWYKLHPTPILIVNDLSIYLHHGDPSLLYNKYIKLAETFIGNAYYGRGLVDRFGLNIDNIERERVEWITKKMDYTIRL